MLFIEGRILRTVFAIFFFPSKSIPYVFFRNINKYSIYFGISNDIDIVTYNIRPVGLPFYLIYVQSVLSWDFNKLYRDKIKDNLLKIITLWAYYW